MINEIFPNPTVRQVFFEIRFSNTFYLENRIGEFQQQIMRRFPKSSMIIKGEKIWQFESNDNIKLGLTTHNLGIESNNHETYNLESEHRLRGIIKFVLDNFFSIVPIPMISYVGLRYINECPIQSKENTSFREYYNSAFPLDRFDLSTVYEQESKVIIQRDRYFLKRIERLSKIEDIYKLVLDFDAQTDIFETTDYLRTIDYLHVMISEEFEQTIRDPVYSYMRQDRRID